MRRGILTAFRVHGRWLGRVLAAVLVVPLLLGLLPQPALSASAAFEHDLMAAVCGQQAPRPAGEGHGHPRDHCILCATGCVNCSPSLSAPAPAFPSRPAAVAAATVPATLSAGPPGPVLRTAGPPRGPPAPS